MPLDVPAVPPGTTEFDLQFFEPEVLGADSDDWQDALRQIFATEDGIWRRRAVERRSVAR